MPSFVVSVGDLIEGYTKDPALLAEQWKEFQGYVHKLQMPFFYVAGNHDVANAVEAREWEARFTPLVADKLRGKRKGHIGRSWHVDETYIRVKGKWAYLYRALDSTGASIDFLLSAKRDAAAAKRFFQNALSSPNHPAPRVINVDRNPSYPPVIEELKTEGTLRRRCRLRPVQYLNNIVEQDHRAIKRRVRASQGFRSFWGAWRTIDALGLNGLIRSRKWDPSSIAFDQV